MDEDARLIVRFFKGQGSDHMGRSLDEILTWDDRQLEDVHDYIQWLFPLFVRSPFNECAPVLTEDARQAFTEGFEHELLQGSLRRAFGRMLRFYGMTLDTRSCSQAGGSTNAECSIVRASNWSEASANWLHPGNHNYRRITRILRSLRALGLESLSTAFLQTLEAIAREHREAVTPDALGFWREAAGLVTKRYN